MALGLRLALGAALLLLGTSSQGAAPQASVTSPRTSCAAPCAIFFDARGTSDADLSRDAEFSDLIYSWEFGDPGSGDWEQGARAGTGTPHSRNVDTGFVAGHVYENPGTYTATLTVSDGDTTDTDSIVVSIQDPNSVWPGNNTVCISSSGTPSAGSGGCPSGAATVFSSDYDQIMFGNGCASTSRRCLFKRGDQFTASTTVTMTTSGPTLIGAYGSGAKPRINQQLGADLFRFDPGNGDIRVVDLELWGANGGGRGSGVALAVEATGTQLHRMLGLRLDIRRFDHGIHFRGPNQYFTPGINIPTEIAIVDSTVLDGPGLGGNDVYVMWEKSLFLGNRVGDKFDGANGLGEHIMRAKFSHGVAYGHNSMGLLNDSGGRIGCGTIRHVLKLVSGLAADHPGIGVSREHIVADNYFSSCKNNVWDVDIGRTDSRIEKVEEGQRNYIVERNYFTKRYSTRSSTTSLQVEGDHPIVRNNILDLSGPGATGTPRGIVVWNRAPISNPPVPTTGVQIVNNTCYEDSATLGDGLCIQIGNEASGTSVRNNVLFDGGPGRAEGPAELMLDSGSGTSTCSGCNVYTTSSPFVSATPTTLSHYAPASGSSLVDAGDYAPASPINFTSYVGAMDGDDNGSALVDIGAWERDGDPPPDGSGGGGGGGGGNNDQPPAPPVLLP